jgi:hypothetical protein
MKYFLRRTVKPKNKEELTSGIRKFWSSVDHKKCEVYINHILKAADLIVKNKGGPAGH